MNSTSQLTQPEIPSSSDPSASAPANQLPSAPSAPSKPAKVTSKKEAAQMASFLTERLSEKLSSYSSDSVYISRLKSIAVNAVMQNPSLLLAMKTPIGQSTFQFAVCKAAEINLLPDGQQGVILCYGSECQFQPMYQGLIEIAYRSGAVSGFRRGTVCENDDFLWDMGEIQRHRIDFSKPRGKVIGYWIRVLFRDHNVADHFMSVDEVSDVRKLSKAPNSPAWTKRFDEMAYKTVFRNLYKWLPKTEALTQAFAVSDSEFDLDRSSSKSDNKFFQASSSDHSSDLAIQVLED